MRIEDDMLVTETGVEWMTKNLPRSIAGIEAFMANNQLSVASDLPDNKLDVFSILRLSDNRKSSFEK